MQRGVYAAQCAMWLQCAFASFEIRLMVSSALGSAYTICKDVAGVAGNIFAFGLFVSPIPTFRRIIRTRSTEQFSGMPYVYALLNCLISSWYGTPLVSSDNLLVTTVNSVGAVFQLIYISLFISYAEKVKKKMMFGVVSAVFGTFAVILVMSLELFDQPIRRYFVGSLSVIALVSMFASPLFIINLVIRTKSVEYMPFYLSLSTFLMSASFFAYGIFNHDIFIYVPNGIGTLLGVVQLGLYCYYKSTPEEDSSEPLMISYR